MTALDNAFPLLGEADWRKAAETALKGGSLDKLVQKLPDGLSLRPLYPARQGPRPLRADAGWRALSRMDHPNAGDANAQALEDLANGADGLQIVFAGAAGAYGFGLGRADAAFLGRALEGVSFDQGAAFELDLGPEGEAQAAAFAQHVVRTGALPGGARIAFGLDPLGARARSGRAARPWDAEAASLGKAVAALAGQGFAGPFVAADARPVHAAGGTPAQELSFALGAGVAYLRALTEAGQPLEQARDGIGFRLAADADEFLTLSKFRALRILWARVEEACGLAPKPAHVHGESAWRMMTVREPYVNVMRAALAAFSAGLGGADSVALLPLSQAVGLPDAFARRLARNTQLIELRESRLGFVADPAAGAGVFEALTQGLCEKAWALFQSHEAAGGLPRALETGAVQAAVAESAAALRRDAARLKTLMTGVSAHAHLAEAPIDGLPASPVAAEAPGEPFAPPLAPMRLAEEFERLRDAAESATPRPSVFLAAMGPLSLHGRRVGFAREVFEAGGIEAIVDAGDCPAAESAARFAASGARLACLCGTDEAYAAEASAFAAALKAKGAARVWLAGKPADEAAMRAGGLDDFLFAGADQIATLERALRAAGVDVRGRVP